MSSSLHPGARDPAASQAATPSGLPLPRTARSRPVLVDKRSRRALNRSSRHAPVSELLTTLCISQNERLDRGRHESPRPRTLGPADEPLSTSATPRRCVDTRDGRRIYRWADCRGLAVYVWKRSINANGVRRWQDSLGILVERYRKPQSTIGLSPSFCSMIAAAKIFGPRNIPLFAALSLASEMRLALQRW